MRSTKPLPLRRMCLPRRYRNLSTLLNPLHQQVYPRLPHRTSRIMIRRSVHAPLGRTLQRLHRQLRRRRRMPVNLRHSHLPRTILSRSNRPRRSPLVLHKKKWIS
jgi:hypothetical protein